MMKHWKWWQLLYSWPGLFSGTEKFPQVWLPNTSQALSLQCVSRSADRILIHIRPHPFGLLSGVSLNLLSLFRTQGRSLALVIFAALSSTLILFVHLRGITMFGLHHSWLWGAVLCTVGCLATLLDFTHGMPESLVKIRSVSRHCQMPWSRKVSQLALVQNHKFFIGNLLISLQRYIPI